MNKLNAARALMIASIAVVAAFQVYWLHNLYREEYDGLKRSTDIIFKETIYQFQVDRLESDSSLMNFGRGNVFSGDMVKVLRIGKDSLPKGTKVFVSMTETKTTESEDSLQIKDSTRRIILRSTSGKPPRAGERPANFRLSHSLQDSLNSDSLRMSYSASLLKGGIDLKYIIIKTSLEDEHPCPASFCTAKVPVGLFGQTCYVAAFSEPTSYLLKQISTQILLSFLVVLLTVLSFIFIYRNLLGHKRLADIKNEFISNITHELKTPIATVTVAIEAMKNFNALQNPERTREYLDIADNELQRLSLLVDKVLKLSMFEQEQLELKFESIDLRQLTAEVMSSMKIQFEKHKATVQLLTEDQPYVMHGDRLHLTSMIYNLIDNAIKYSPNKPVITISLSETESNVRLEIQDNGIGISSEYRDKIFDKFFRVPGGNKHNVKGYGLGLSYVAHIISKHSGSIKVESQPGAGSLFIIDLPKNNEKSQDIIH